MKRRSSFAYPYIVWMLGFIVAPMFFILYYAFVGADGVTLSFMGEALSRENLSILGDSVLIAALTTAVCLLLGYPVALLLSRMRKSVAAMLSTFFIVPMWMNFLLRTYAWRVLLQGFMPGMLNTLPAVLLGMVYNFLPFMILPIYTVLQKLDKSYLEAAQDLGAAPAKTFTRVVLPLSVPGIVSGATMVFVPAITAFAISQLLGGKMTGMLYGDLIYNKFMLYNLPELGSALSLVLLVFVLISMSAMRWADRERGEEGGKLW